MGTDAKRVTRALWNILYSGGKLASVPVLWDGQASARIASHLGSWLQARSNPAHPPEVAAASFLKRQARTEDIGVSIASEVTK